MRRRSFTRPFQGRTILVVEDHEDSLNVSRLILEAHGARVVCATNGLEALKALETEQPDLILCDLRMPVMDGYAFMTRLRRNPRLARLRVIAVTALGEYPDMLQTWAAGFDGHLPKPVDVDTLVAVVKRALWAHHPTRLRSSRRYDRRPH